MLSDRLARTLAAQGIHYGWATVSIACLVSLTTAAAVGMPGAFILPLSKEFGWDTAQISFALGVRLALFGLMAPFAATFMERYGIRTIVLISTGMLICSMTATQSIGHLWQLFLLWGLVDGIASGLTAAALSSTVANRWFTKRRGMAIGLMSAALGTGFIIFIPLSAVMIEKFGWRVALWPAIGSMALVWILVFAFIRERPVDVGIPPLGETAIVPAPVITGSIFTTIRRSFSILGQASGHMMFWVLSGSFFVCGLSSNGLINTHFIPFCFDFGIGGVMAASALGLMGLFNIVGSLGSGYLSDKIDNRLLLFAYYGFRGVSLIYLPYSDFSVYALTIFAILFGLDFIATVPPTQKLTAAAFGREKAPIVFGWIFSAHQLGAATAAYGGGYSRTEFLSYLPAFILAGIACLVVAALFLALRAFAGGAPVGGKPVTV